MTRDGAVAFVKQLLKPLNVSFYQDGSGGDTYILNLLQTGLDIMTSIKGIYAQYSNADDPLDDDTSMTLPARVVDIKSMSLQETATSDPVSMYAGVNYMPHGTIVDFIEGPPPDDIPMELTGTITVTLTMMAVDLQGTGATGSTVIDLPSPYDMAAVYYACAILSQQSQSDRSYEWMTQFESLKRLWLSSGQNDIIMLVHPRSDDAADITV